MLRILGRRVFTITVIIIAAVMVVACSSSDSEAVPAAEADEAAVSAAQPGPGVALPEIISPAQYREVFAEGEQEYFLLDVRTADEFNSGHIDGAYNISHEMLASRLDELPSDVPIVLYCRSGNRSSVARDVLRDAGYTNFYDIDGGTNNWTRQGYTLVR